MRKRGSHLQTDAAALVIVLAFVVLLAAIVVAYLTRTGTDRQLSHGTFHGVTADELGKSALAIVLGDLKQEIVDGSTPSTVADITLYTPTSPTNMLPQRSGTPPGAPGIPNLVRRSIRSDPIAAPGVGSRASVLSTAPSPSPLPVAAKKGEITMARWNRHYLVPRQNAGSTTVDTTPLSSFTAPDWVLVTTTGPRAFTAWDVTLRDTSTANFAIGRYAYAIYDEAGLLDMNVAGFPLPVPTPGVSPPQRYAFKGNLAFADLTVSSGTNIPRAKVDDFVGWRNYASTQPGGDFENDFIFSNASLQRYYTLIAQSKGFLTVPTTVWNGHTDQAVISRQQLIGLRSALGSGTGFTQDALQYLSTFSRTLNSPTFSPPVPSVVNPDLSRLRASAAFARFDGSTATIGEPLIKTRFPLSRLAWITYRGPSASLSATDPVIVQLIANGVSLSTIQAGTAANIQRCFGLSYVSPNLWTYSHGAADRISLLSEVASLGREPDFVELLQAGILSGSLGQNTGGGVTGGVTVFPDVHMSNTAHHLLSIAAAILDQADPDSIPTRIQFAPTGLMWTAYGVESLPYITQIYPIAGANPSDPTQWATYLLFQLWNPHQNIPNRPGVRLRIDGGLGLFRGGNGELWTNGGTDFFYPAAQSIVLSPTASFAPSPSPLLTTNTTGAGAAGSVGEFVPLPAPPASLPAPGPLIGFRLPNYSYPSPSPRPSATPVLYLQVGASTGPTLATRNRFNATMEVDVGGGTYVPYNHFIGIDDSSSWVTDDPLPVRLASSIITGAPNPFTNAQLAQTPPAALMKADPRATRFGMVQTSAVTGNSTISEPLWPSTLPNGYGGTIADPGGLVEHVPIRFSTAGLPFFPATLALNSGPSTVSRTTYADNDGVIRPADSAYPEPTPAANPTPRFSTPYYPAPTPAPSPTPPPNTTLAFNDYKPVILNRPLYSVGELGYAFRDLPWKTIDFFTDSSGDAGLLDLFTINEEPPMVAGHVSLNTRQASVLQTILAGTLQAELDANDTIAKTGVGQTTAPIIAANVVMATAVTPFRNRAELITRPGTPTAILPVPASGSAHNQRVKARREVVVRALSSVSQTRTWNLMIDLIAQSGRYPPTANGLSDFVVQGEKRYWLHVAIDRFTGEVIDQQLEAVYE